MVFRTFSSIIGSRNRGIPCPISDSPIPDLRDPRNGTVSIEWDSLASKLREIKKAKEVYDVTNCVSVA